MWLDCTCPHSWLMTDAAAVCPCPLPLVCCLLLAAASTAEAREAAAAAALDACLLQAGPACNQHASGFCSDVVGCK